MREWYEVEDAEMIPSPTLLVYPERIEANLKHLICSVGDPSKLRPHVKTHKMPQVVQMKLSLGITKFKVATIAEAEMTAQAGAEDVLIAFPMVGPNLVRVVRLVERVPATRFSVTVDCLRSSMQLNDVARSADSRVGVYLDIDVGMGRTGIRPGPDALTLYQELSQMEHLEVMGLHVYDGHIQGLDKCQTEAEVERVFTPIWEMRDELVARGLPLPNIIAGGTQTSIELAKREGVEVGAGTVALWDSGQDALSPNLGFEPAAVLLTRVVSHPQGKRLCLDLGYKSVASEMPVPRVSLLGFGPVEWVGHSEEHMVIQSGNVDDHPVGSIVYAVPKHICPTVALHAQVGVIQHNRLIDQWPISARNRSLTI